MRPELFELLSLAHRLCSCAHIAPKPPPVGQGGVGDSALLVRRRSSRKRRPQPDWRQAAGAAQRAAGNRFILNSRGSGDHMAHEGALEVHLLEGIKLRDTQTFGER